MSSKVDLRNYVKVFLGVEIPDIVVCEGHSSPMDYLWHCFNSDFCGVRGNSDAIVWANRAGGKTQLAAIATLLDCIFKDGCQVRILGGSGAQAGRMYEYLRGFLQRSFLGDVDGKILNSGCKFLNGSSVEVLTQSHTSVRGQHIQKLRCDEVELFSSEVFSAAKFTTHSKGFINASMEVLSTMHRPYGLMQKLVDESGDNGTALFKWCLWEVIERCRDRECSQCRLWNDCGGRAKESDGYLSIDDCITMRGRASSAGWQSEMLCERPNLEDVVFDEFDSEVNVVDVGYDERLGLYRAIDFGFVNPFVCLWIQVDEDGVVRVIDEYIKSRMTVEQHGEAIKKLTPCSEEYVSGTFCDPAGAGVNDVSGTSAVRELRRLGIKVSYRKSGILEGIEHVRRAVLSGDGKRRLLISGRCRRLIESMRCYHYPEKMSESELPVKDGVYDHAIDALRYFFVNYSRKYRTFTRKY